MEMICLAILKTVYYIKIQWIMQWGNILPVYGHCQDKFDEKFVKLTFFEKNTAILEPIGLPGKDNNKRPDGSTCTTCKKRKMTSLVRTLSANRMSKKPLPKWALLQLARKTKKYKNKAICQKITIFCPLVARLRKIQINFEIENWFWNSDFGTFWHFPVNPILKIQ